MVKLTMCGGGLVFALVADEFVVDALEDGGVGVFVFGSEGFCGDAVFDVFDGAACFAQLAVELGVGVGCDVWVVVRGVHLDFEFWILDVECYLFAVEPKPPSARSVGVRWSTRVSLIWWTFSSLSCPQTSPVSGTSS